jgi:hypothetical protein
MYSIILSHNVIYVQLIFFAKSTFNAKISLLLPSKYWRNNLVKLGISSQIFFFSKVGARPMSSTLFTQGKKSKHYLGIEPSTFGVAVGDANHYTIRLSTVSNNFLLKKLDNYNNLKKRTLSSD